FSDGNDLVYSMQRFDYNSPRFRARLDRFSRNVTASAHLEETVAAIIADVEKRGDKAITELAAKFDKAELKPSAFRVPEEELRAAARRIPASRKKAIRESIESVTEFARRGVPKDWKARNRHGAI